MEEIQGERRSSSSDRYNSSDKEGLLSFRDPELRTRRTWLCQPLTMPILHISLILAPFCSSSSNTTLTPIFLAINTSSTVGKWYRTIQPATADHTVSTAPLIKVLVPEKKFVHATFRSRNPYKGAPSPELDHAWHQIFVNSNIRVSARDLEKINKTSVPVGDGKGGYYAIPGRLTSNQRSSR